MISLLFEHHIFRFAFGFCNPNHAVAMICFVLFVASHPSVHKITACDGQYSAWVFDRKHYVVV